MNSILKSNAVVAFPDEDYDPYDERFLKRGLKYWEAINLLLRGFLGTGLLLLPEAFRFSGILVGIVDLIIVSIFVTYTYHLMLKSRLQLCKMLRVPRLYYPEVMQIGFKFGPGCLKFFSPIMGICVDVLCIINQLNQLCAYLWHMASDLERVFETWYGKGFPHSSYVLILGPYLVILMCVKDMKVYARFAVVSNILSLVSICFMIYHMVQDLPNFTLLPPATEFSTHILFFVPALFAIQSIPVTSTIELNYLKGQYFLSMPGLLCQAYGLLTVLCFIIALIGYWRYEDGIKMLTLNLDISHWEVQAAVILFFLGMYISYGLQGHIGLYVLWEHYLSLWINPPWEYVKPIIEYFIRISVFVVLPVVIIIYLRTGLPLFLAVHGICHSFLGIIFPALLEISVIWPSQKFGACYYIFFKDITIVVIGILVLIVSVYHGQRFFSNQLNGTW
ncbi:unnamed protein product [Phyllotreta striolata]|uniref:Amino acid transporter transmembrane domain-containing protein n=1 Tax=Phyllotreta striolata TaxID=444603 RepID=A0A9N9TDA6_PHYSR|nr:unnamed protein product [Phyllotreta striolata]